MRYTNPVVKGFYPDPSVCCADGIYYMVCSSFQYFPGVPLFESRDLVNWRQTGHVLTRESQVALAQVESSGGVFAPTIRYHQGRFYMVTTNATTHENFYVCTDDIHGPWSDPIIVDQDGIDPSLLFDGDHVYFLSNGSDDFGDHGVVQCEIDIATGKKRSPSRCIWHGTGGRFLESPHMYHIGDRYYLMAAEGGTEYGHMIIYARADHVWGPFESYPGNPVLTNRNKAPGVIQGIGHGDLIQDEHGDWHILCLGFRQIHLWQAYHTLGREVFLIPVEFGADGWFTAGRDGTAEETYEIKGDFLQAAPSVYTFENTDPDIDWCYLRHPRRENYRFSPNAVTLRGSGVTLDQAANPTFLGIRQREFCFELRVDLSLDRDEAGVTVYSCEDEHYDAALRREGTQTYAVLKLNLGGIKHLEKQVPLETNAATLLVRADHLTYRFYVSDGSGERYLGQGRAKYLSSEVSGSFTGVVLGLYAVGDNTAEFTEFRLKYENNGQLTMDNEGVLSGRFMI